MKKNILLQMFDVRPVNAEGKLDHEWIARASNTLRLDSVAWRKQEPLTRALRQDPFLERLLRKEFRRRERIFRNLASRMLEEKEDGEGREVAFPVPREKIDGELASIEAQDAYLRNLFARRPEVRSAAWELFEKTMLADTYEKEWRTRGLKPVRAFRGSDGAIARPQMKARVAEAPPPFSLSRVAVAKRRPRRAGVSFRGIRKYFSKRMASVFVLGIVAMSLAWFFGRGMNQWYTRTLADAFAAAAYLEQARDAALGGDIEGSNEAFRSASRLLQRSERRTHILDFSSSFFLRSLPGIRKIASTRHALRAATYLARAGERLTEAGKSIQNFSLQGQPSENGRRNASGAFLASALPIVREGFVDIKQAEKEIGAVDLRHLPLSLRAKIIEVENDLPGMLGTFEEANAALPAIAELLGENGPRRYLLLFQNTDEKRATGGFLGTYATLKAAHGIITLSPVRDIYDVDGQLNVAVTPPLPLQEITSAWSTHDANWFFDFPTSARKIAWFFEKTGEPTVDGVLAFTPAIFERTLALTGPIPMPEYGVTFSSENFIPSIEAEVESVEARRSSRPKQILSDFSPRLVEKIFQFDLGKKKELFSFVLESLRRKDIQVFFSDPELQQLAEARGWSGAVRESGGDYLAVVHSNILGNKTDRMMEEDIDLESELQSNGSAVNTLRITRAHRGGDAPNDIWNTQNRDYLRVYVPKGSLLLDVSGHTPYTVQPLKQKENNVSFVQDSMLASISMTARRDFENGTEIFEESGKTVFGNWVFINPGESATVTYRYRTPPGKKEGMHTLLIQKQAGNALKSFHYRVRAPAGKNFRDPATGVVSSSMTFTPSLTQDVLLRMPFE